MNNSRLAKELERYNLGHFIPWSTEWWMPLLEDNAVGFFFATLLLVKILTSV